MNTYTSFNGQGGGTPAPEFGQAPGAGATGPTGSTGPSERQFEPTGLSDWLGTDDARRLAGRWVLLTNDFRVIDSRETPKELLDAHPEERAPFIVYVDPSGRQQAV